MANVNKQAKKNLEGMHFWLGTMTSNETLTPYLKNPPKGAILGLINDSLIAKEIGCSTKALRRKEDGKYTELAQIYQSAKAKFIADGWSGKPNERKAAQGEIDISENVKDEQRGLGMSRIQMENDQLRQDNEDLRAEIASLRAEGKSLQMLRNVLRQSGEVPIL